jgi:hypothetical protein
VLAQTGLTFDLSTSSGKLMRTLAGLAEFERDLIIYGSASSLGSRPPRRAPSGSDASMGSGHQTRKRRTAAARPPTTAASNAMTANVGAAARRNQLAAEEGHIDVSG